MIPGSPDTILLLTAIASLQMQTMSDSRKVQEFPGEDPTKKEMQDWLDWLNAEIKGSDIDHLIAGRVPTSLISISRVCETAHMSASPASHCDSGGSGPVQGLFPHGGQSSCACGASV